MRNYPVLVLFVVVGLVRWMKYNVAMSSSAQRSADLPARCAAAAEQCGGFGRDQDPVTLGEGRSLDCPTKS